MRKIATIVIAMLILMAAGFTGAAETLDKHDRAVSVDRDFGKMPLYFIENQGQLDKEVGFYVQGSDKTLYFTGQEVTFALAGKKDESEEAQRWVVKLDFVGANPDVRPIGEDRQQAVISYFKGKREDWKTGLATYRRIVYPNLWDGIDLVYSGSVNQLKYEFVVKPGADTKQIRLAYRGAGNVTVKETGELMVETPVGGFADGAPYAYQEKDGRRAAVDMAYMLEERSCEGIFEYGFDVGPYDTSLSVILDPAVLIYCGYIGGTDDDWGNGIAVDDSGNAYVTGVTYSSEAEGFPVVVGPDLTFNGSSYDAFVAKVNAAGTGLDYCGYIGGSAREDGQDIAVDAAGHAYVTGYTQSSEASFPVAVGLDLTFNGGSDDAFVAKVKADGTGLDYCGYIGGTGSETGFGIAVDDANNAYVTGETQSSEANSFPVVVGLDLTYNGGRDVFVAKISPGPTLPGVVKSLSVRGGHKQLALSWEEPNDNGGSEITHYKIHRGPNEVELNYYDQVDGGDLNFVDPNVQNGTIYYYAVSAVNEYGEGEHSAAVSETANWNDLDLNGDGIINLIDLAIFFKEWLWEASWHES